MCIMYIMTHYMSQYVSYILYDPYLLLQARQGKGARVARGKVEERRRRARKRGTPLASARPSTSPFLMSR
jgi:hypothetical protein